MRTGALTRTLENLFGELMHGVSGKGGFMLNDPFTEPGRPAVDGGFFRVGYVPTRC